MMTCIAGIAEGGKAWIGADSAATGGDIQTVRADRKVFGRNGYIIGFAGSFRMGQIIDHCVDLPVRPASEDAFAFMVRTVVPLFREALAGEGFAPLAGADEPLGDSSMLVGLGGRLFMVDCDWQVGEAAAGYHAIGSAAAPALGALYAAARAPHRAEPRERLELALSAAAEHSASVRWPFHIVGPVADWMPGKSPRRAKVPA